MAMSLRLVSPADSRAMPWKNGGGSTLEIAASPAGAGLDDFLWRASIARIERDGPFSAFPGIDRTLLLLEGAGMRLAIDHERVEVTTLHAAVAFAGEAGVECELVAGSTRDFNFMVRRSRARAEVTVVDGAAHTAPRADALVCHVVRASCTCEPPGHAPVVVEAGCTLVVEGEDAARGLRVVPDATLAVAILATVQAVPA